MTSQRQEIFPFSCSSSREIWIIEKKSSEKENDLFFSEVKRNPPKFESADGCTMQLVKIGGKEMPATPLGDGEIFCTKLYMANANIIGVSAARQQLW